MDGDREELVPGHLRDTLAHWHTPGAGHWPPDPPFAAVADPDVQLGAMLAKAVYEPRDDMLRYIKKYDASILKIDEPELDRAGNYQFAFFCRVKKGQPPVTWTVARGTQMKDNWDDLWTDILYLMPGRPWANPDLHKLVQFHDACCHQTDGLSDLPSFRRIAVGHSKAGAEVAELALKRSHASKHGTSAPVEAHAFNDGGALNLNAMLSSANVTCHRIRSDIICNLRCTVGKTLYYAKSMDSTSPHSIDNFLPQPDHASRPVSVPFTTLLGRFGVGLVVACTKDQARDDPPHLFHPTQHSIVAVGTWLCSFPFEVLQHRCFTDAAQVAFRHSIWASLRSMCAVGSPCWQSFKVLVMAAAEVLYLQVKDPAWVAACMLEAGAAGCFASGYCTCGVALQFARNLLAQRLRHRCFEIDTARDLLMSVALGVTPHIGQSIGGVLGSLIMGSCPPLPLCCSIGQATDSSSSLSFMLRWWATRDLGAVVGAQLGARLATTWPQFYLGVYSLPLGFAFAAAVFRQR